METEKEYWAKREGYLNIHDLRYSQPVQLSLVRASIETLKPYGHIVTDYDSEAVTIETWPAPGRRPIIDGTGRGASILDETFRVFWEDGGYVRVEDIPPGDTDDDVIAGRSRGCDVRDSVLVRDLTAHPDGGQVFYPERPEPFVMVLAAPKDEVTPSDVEAFYFDGSFGVQINTNVWHHFPFPIGQELTFRSKQSAVFACIMVDFVKEFGTFLKVPLNIRN